MNAVSTGSCCFVTGKLLKQDGEWKKTAVGAGLGSIVGGIGIIYAFNCGEGGGGELYALPIAITISAFSAVVGFNLKSKSVNPH